MGFHGVLTFVGVPSDKAPSGAQGHRVLLTRAATDRALPSLLGMAVDYAPTLDRHDARRKVGIITRAEVLPARPGLKAKAGGESSHSGSWSGGKAADARMLRAGAASRGVEPRSSFSRSRPEPPRIDVTGYLFARDFPELIGEIRKGGPQVLGMSYEITDARIEDLRASIWTISEFVFTGAAILRRDKAAYQNTWIVLE
jgi:hypothetical protein